MGLLTLWSLEVRHQQRMHMVIFSRTRIKMLCWNKRVRAHVKVCVSVGVCEARDVASVAVRVTVTVRVVVKASVKVHVKVNVILNVFATLAVIVPMHMCL